MADIHDVEVILVGDELLKGERFDAHLAFLGRALGRLGVRVARAHIVGDSIDRLAALVSERRAKTRVLVVTGGLGPTPDDVTREGVAVGLSVPLVFHAASWEHIREFFARRGWEATENNRRQAMFPQEAVVLDNPNGTAPGFVVESHGTTVFALPGPPRELHAMFERHVAERIEAAFARAPLRVETFRTILVGESQLLVWFGDLFDGLRAFDVSSLPWVTGVDVVLTARRGAGATELDDEAARVEGEMRARLGSKLYGRGDRTLAGVLGDALRRRGETLAIAESLTGGWVSKLVTDVPGSSEYFLADAVSYGNRSKVDLLGVDGDVIERDGAVSEAVCRSMADGARRRCGATWGVSTTGIAGPSGATPDKPLGLTYLGLSWAGGGTVVRRTYGGGRDVVRERAAYGALWMLYDHLETGGTR